MLTATNTSIPKALVSYPNCHAVNAAKLTSDINSLVTSHFPEAGYVDPFMCTLA